MPTSIAADPISNIWLALLITMAIGRRRVVDLQRRGDVH
jgi:hypothetical protein